MNILCRMCGVVCNHMTGLCNKCRPALLHMGANYGMSKADVAYLEWKAQSDSAKDGP